MKDSSISKYHLFSGVSVMVIAYLTLTTVVLYLKCFKLYVPDFLDALRTQGMSANMYSDLFLIVFPAVILLLLYVVSFHFSYQYFGVLYLTQEGVLLKAPFVLSGDSGIGHRRGNDQAVLDLYQQAKNPTEVSAQDQPDLQFRPA
mgnify:CR=1 FL=1